MEKIATSFLIINVVSFIVLGLDKNRAKTGNWRVSERSLFVLAFIGGAIGIYLGMRIFRHKTKQLHFTHGIPLIIFLNLFLIYYYLIR